MSILSAVQHERGPRNSTIRRQVAMYLKETSELDAVISPHHYRSHYLNGYMALEHINDGVTVTAADTPSVSPPILIQPTPKVRMCVNTSHLFKVQICVSNIDVYDN
jgi:hypothetical protein